MPEIPPIDKAELEAFRMGLPEIDRNEIRNDGIPWDIVKARYLAYRANRQPVEADTDTCWKNIRWISDIRGCVQSGLRSLDEVTEQKRCIFCQASL